MTFKYLITYIYIKFQMTQLQQHEPWKKYDFIFKKQLGVGQFGVVYEAIQRHSGRPVAIKIIPKHKITSKTLYIRLRRQIEIHSRLKHQSICRMYGYFTDLNNIYLVLQFCPNSSLYIPIKLLHESLSARKISSLSLQLLSAIAYLSSRSVIHRDIKLQNILFDRDYNIKLSDFGCCVHTFKNRRTVCGTLQYLCPEMLQDSQYDHRVDLYCLGVVVYEMFFGKGPFWGKDDREEDGYRNVKQGVIVWEWDIGPRAKHFITKLLGRPRPTVQEMMKHQFIIMCGEEVESALKVQEQNRHKAKQDENVRNQQKLDDVKHKKVDEYQIQNDKETQNKQEQQNVFTQ